MTEIYTIEDGKKDVSSLEGTTIKKHVQKAAKLSLLNIANKIFRFKFNILAAFLHWDQACLP